ncbi:MAG: hypothetical protein R6X15_06410 [Pseudomonadota bacterium]
MDEMTTREELVERTKTAALLHDTLPHKDGEVLPVIDWAGLNKYAPVAMESEPPQPFDALPTADVVVMTWTVAEWAAMHHVFCGYSTEMPISEVYKHDWRKGWLPYSRNYCQIHQYMVDVEKTYQGGAPSLRKSAWGFYRLVEVNGLRVLLVKSEMHLAQDGTGLPLKQFVHQLCDEVSPSLVLSIGTAGGVRSEDALGTAIVTNQAYFHLLKEFASSSFNHITVQSSWEPQTKFIDATQKWLIQVDGFDVDPISPQYPKGAVIQPDAPDSRIKVVLDSPIITTDTFLFGTTDNGLEKYGCIVEMDDAVVGLACREEEVPFGFIRNVSDPVINGALPASIQDTWAGYIYKERGLFTSFNGALATWALIAGESDRT